jgi:hypothetical protein
MKLNGNDELNTLTETLDKAMQNLRNNDYEDNDSETFHILSDFISAAETMDKLKEHESARLIKSAEALMDIID